MKILVFDVGGTAIKYGMVDENFDVLFSEEMPTNAFYGGNGVMKSLEMNRYKHRRSGRF